MTRRSDAEIDAELAHALDVDGALHDLNTPRRGTMRELYADMHAAYLEREAEKERIAEYDRQKRARYAAWLASREDGA